MRKLELSSCPNLDGYRIHVIVTNQTSGM